jgi:hypothetical protein
MIIKNRTINASLLILACISLFGIIAGSNEGILSVLKGTAIELPLYHLHSGNQIIFSLSGGFLISIFFWFLVVKLPEMRKRNIIKHNISTQYQHFKEDTIEILLWASIGTHDSQLPRQLCDYKEFKKFFGENEHQKWYDALNGLQSKQDLLNDILVEMELLSNEISYVLNNVEITDERIMSVFKTLSINVYKLKSSSIFSYDQVKYLGNFLWGILAQWSFIDSQRKEDIIQKMINKL